MNKSKVGNFLIYNFPTVKVSTNVIAKDDSICDNYKYVTKFNEKVVCAKFAHTTEQDLKNRENLNVDYLNLNVANSNFNEGNRSFSFSEYQHE